MTTSPVVTITEELVEELERFLGFGGQYLKVSSETLRGLLAERAAMQSQIKAGIVTQDNLELYRKDALRYQLFAGTLVADCTGAKKSAEQAALYAAMNAIEKVESIGEISAVVDQAMQEQQP